MNPDEVHEEMLIPAYFAPILIGPKGETATKIRTETGVRLCHLSSLENAPGDKIVHLVGKDKAVSKAKALIEEMLDSSLRDTVQIPANKVNLVVGVSGATLKWIMDATGVKSINFDTAEFNSKEPTKTLLFIGGRAEIDAAKREVNELITSSQQPSTSGTEVIEEVVIPAAACGYVIGKGGETIGRLMSDSGTAMHLVQQSSSDYGDKPLRIQGTREAVERAKKLVKELLDSFVIQVHEELLLEPGLAGKVIGTGGEILRSIKAQSGVSKMFVEQYEQSAERGFIGQVLHLTGTESAIECAKTLVSGVLTHSHLPPPRTISVTNVQQSSITPPFVTWSLPIPREIASLIVGRSADMFRVLLESTGARLKFDTYELMSQSSVLTATISGREEQCRCVMDHVGRLVQSHAYLIGNQHGPAMHPTIGPINIPPPMPQPPLYLQHAAMDDTSNTPEASSGPAADSTDAGDAIIPPPTPPLLAHPPVSLNEQQTVAASSNDASAFPETSGPAVDSIDATNATPSSAANSSRDASSPTNGPGTPTDSASSTPSSSAAEVQSPASVQRPVEEQAPLRARPNRKRLNSSVIECITIDDD